MKPMRPWIRKMIVKAVAAAYRRGGDPALLEQAVSRVFAKRRTQGWCDKLWADAKEAGGK